MTKTYFSFKKPEKVQDFCCGRKQTCGNMKLK